MARHTAAHGKTVRCDKRRPHTLAHRTRIRGQGFEVDANKYDYFFGHVAPPPAALRATNPQAYTKLHHNYARGQQLKTVLAALGIFDDAAGRQQLLALFAEGTTAPEVARHVGEYGTTRTTEVLREGVKLQIKYFYLGSHMHTVPTVVSIIPKVLRS
jgi:hypothetical protein